MDAHRPRWLDLSTNAQSVLLIAIAAVSGSIVMQYSLVGRVQTLEEHDRQQLGA